MYVLVPPPPPLSSPPRFPFSFYPSTQFVYYFIHSVLQGTSRLTSGSITLDQSRTWMSLPPLVTSPFPPSIIHFPPLLPCSFSLPSSPLCLYTGLDEILIEFGWCGSTIGSPLNVNDGYNIYDENGNDQVNSDGVCPFLPFFLPFNLLFSLHSLVVPPHLPFPLSLTPYFQVSWMFSKLAIRGGPRQPPSVINLKPIFQHIADKYGRGDFYLTNIQH